MLTVALEQEGYKTSLVNYVGKNVLLTGTLVDDADLRRNKAFYLLEAEKIKIDGQTMHTTGRVRIAVHDTERIFEYGDVVRVKGRLKEVNPSGNPGQFDYKVWLERRGIYVVMTVWESHNIDKIGEGDVNFLKATALHVKQKFISVLYSTLPSEHAAIVQGMLFGDRGLISDEISHEFMMTSLIHILCVSGFHVGLVLADFLIIFYLLKIPRYLEAPLGTALLIFYAFMTGLGYSVVRATVMGIILLWTRHFEYERDWPTAMAFAAAVILFIYPSAIFEPGFQLSFAVTFGILHLTSVAEKLLGNMPKKLKLAISVPVIAKITAIPLVVYHFHLISFVGFIANIILAPIISSVMMFAANSVLIGIFSLKLAFIVNAVTSALLDLMLTAVDFLAGLPFAAVFVKSIPSYMIISYYLLLLITARTDRALLKD